MHFKTLPPWLPMSGCDVATAAGPFSGAFTAALTFQVEEAELER